MFHRPIPGIPPANKHEPGTHPTNGPAIVLAEVGYRLVIGH